MAHGPEAERERRVIRVLRATLSLVPPKERERVVQNLLNVYPPEIVAAAAAGLGGNGR